MVRHHRSTSVTCSPHPWRFNTNAKKTFKVTTLQSRKCQGFCRTWRGATASFSSISTPKKATTIFDTNSMPSKKRAVRFPSAPSQINPFEGLGAMWSVVSMWNKQSSWVSTPSSIQTMQSSIVTNSRIRHSAKFVWSSRPNFKRHLARRLWGWPSRALSLKRSWQPWLCFGVASNRSSTEGAGQAVGGRCIGIRWSWQNLRSASLI